MAINHELSSDIAVALLTGKERNPEELNNLKEIVLKIHNTLQRLSTDYRRRKVHAGRAQESDRVVDSK